MMELSKTSWHYKLLMKFDVIQNYRITICSYVTSLLALIAQLVFCTCCTILLTVVLLYGLYGMFDMWVLHNTTVNGIEKIGIILWLAIFTCGIIIGLMALAIFAMFKFQDVNLFNESIRVWKNKVCVFVTFK